MTAQDQDDSFPAVPVLSLVQQARKEGNSAYAAHDYEESVAHYKKALGLLLKPAVACTPDANLEAVTLHCNVAAAHLRLGKPAEAMAECNLALAGQPKHAKALFRRAEARLAVGLLAQALTDAEAARVVAPADAAVRDLIFDIEDAIAAAPTPLKSKQSVERKEQFAGDEQSRTFVEECISEVHASFMASGTAETELRLLHVTPDAGRRQFGRVALDGAFASSSTLRSALAFVRGQHTTADAHAAVLIVDRAQVCFPCVWYAGHWPEELPLDARGVFVQLITRKGSRTWFLNRRGSSSMLDPECELPQDCHLVEAESIFVDAVI
jgi:tetratricopeptide (TPR) repeat protein